MYNPFTLDDNSDIIDPSAALQAAEFEDNFLNHEEPEMTEPTRKIVKKAPAAAAAPAAAKQAAPKAPAKPKAERVNNLKPRTLPEGCLGVTELAREFGIPTATVRRKLRNLEGVNRAEGGMWAWKENSKELANVRKAFAVA